MTFRCLRGVADVDAGCLWSGDGPIFRAFSMALWFPAAPISRSAPSAPCLFPWEMLLIDVPFRRTRWFPRRVFQLVDDIPDLAVARY